MPSSAGLEGNHVDGNERVYLNWQVAAQEVDNNRSLITWQLGWVFATFSCRGLRNGDAVINGAQVYLNLNPGDGVHQYNGGHEHRPALEVAWGSLWIGHNADGTQVLSAYGQLIGFSAQNSQGSASWDLPTIPRFSPPPTAPNPTNITQTSITTQFFQGGGGAPIDFFHLGYGTNPSTPTTIITSSNNGINTISGLAPATTYYFWARNHNSAGYSNWSERAQGETIAGARLRVSGVHKKAIPYVKVAGTWKLARPWTKVMGVWKEDV